MFQVGGLVLCIYQLDDVVRIAGITVPTKGIVYTVRQIVEEGDWVGFRLVEIVNRPRLYMAPIRGPVVEEAVFVTDLFRPLSSDRLSIFRQHLAPSPTDKVDA